MRWESQKAVHSHLRYRSLTSELNNFRHGSDGYVSERKDRHRVLSLEDKETHILSHLVGIISFALYTVKPFIPLLIPFHDCKILPAPILTFPLCLIPIPDVPLCHCLHCWPSLVPMGSTHM